jgi:hypothetical protein
VINNSLHWEEPKGSDPRYLEAILEERPTEEIVADVQQTFATLLSDPNQLERKRRSAFNGVRKHYGIDHLSQRWRRLIQAVQES